MSARRKVAVVGGGLGGLTAAGLLAREGHDVTLFEGSSQLGGKARAARFGALTLDLGPTLLTLPELVRETFRALGAEALVPRFFELERQCEYLYPSGATFSAYRDLGRTASSAARIDPHDGTAVGGFYAEAARLYRAAGEPYLEAPFEGMAAFMARVARRGPSALLAGLRMGSLDDLARKHFRSPELQQFVGRFATYAGASPYQASAAFALIPHLEHAHGVHHVEGGMGALVEALSTAAVLAGVELRMDSPVQRSSPDGLGLIIDDHELRFDAVVMNRDPLAANGRTQPEPLALSGYVLLLEADRRLPLAHHTVRFSSDYRAEFDALFSGRLAEDPTVYFCHPAATDPTMAPEGRSGLFVMANAPAIDAAAGDDEWAAREHTLREQCLAAARSVVGADVGLTVLAERTPRDLERLGAPGGSIYGFLPHGKFGPFRRPRIRGAQPGLFYAGGGTHPGGGVPLVMLSGRFAAELASRHLGGLR